MRKFFVYAGFFAILFIVILGGFVHFSIVLPTSDDRVKLHDLSASAYVDIDNYGIPAIHAQTKEDAFLILGFVTARDRLFQMDLLRRHIAGRLSEVMGKDLKESDRWHRVMGFQQVAREIYQGLPKDQKRVLQAYANGVNQAIESLTFLPPEFWLLGYRPSKWLPEDSLLVVLGMEADLGWTGGQEIRRTIMKAALPESVYRFFNSDIDSYTDHVLNGETSAITLPSIPKDELFALLEASNGKHFVNLVQQEPPPKGSNSWVVGSSKTWDGRAIVANDMHLSLRVPNIWYRAELHYDDIHLIGLTLPGVPLLITGSNGKVAWGFTNIEGDFVDLVSLEIDPDNPEQYRTSNGFIRFGERDETIHIKDEADYIFKVKTTIWGPLLAKQLVSKSVAVHWAALDPKATDLNLLNLDKAQNVEAAQTVFNRSGGPPLNALIADRHGNIGWTYTGKFPKRIAMDGSVSQSWADGTRGWDGYIQPEALPRLINPASGYIVNANQRMLGDDYPYVIGHDFDQGYRAYRISERLSEAKNLTERDMFALQLDTRTEFYRFYHTLALSLLHESDDEDLVRLRNKLKKWDGFAETDSVGFATLVEFRRLLLNRVITPFIYKCLEYDPTFTFSSTMMDVPLQQLLKARIPELLPDKDHYQDWDSFLRKLLVQADENILSPKTTDLIWGEINHVSISHPFSSSLPLFKKWLDMPQSVLPGCVQCIRMSEPGYGASERLVVSPGNEANGILHMPGGQSGHPLSPNYSDQQQAWVKGLALPLSVGKAIHRLDLVPRPELVEQE